MSVKLQIFSDLHLELPYYKPDLYDLRVIPDLHADIVVAAGDICIGTQGAEWLNAQFPNSEIIYILGNHEYYTFDFPGLVDEVRAFSDNQKFHFLEDDSLDLLGYQFFSASLWTDFNLYGDSASAMDQAGSYMNDYYSINGPITPADTLAKHKASMVALQQFLENHNPEKSIVVTHHAPSMKSWGGRDLPGHLGAAYSSNLEELILEYQPKYWIHGHLHRTMNYNIGNTQVIQNGLGYLQKDLLRSNPNFNPQFQIHLF